VSETKTETTQVKRKIPKIVIDRPPLADTRLLLALACGMVGGIVVGGILWLLMLTGESTDFPQALRTPEQPPYVWAWVLIGMLGGFMFGWGYKRETTVRLEKVDAPDMSRRRSTSTALARIDISGRSRY
jgi:hypothetical protein